MSDIRFDTCQTYNEVILIAWKQSPPDERVEVVNALFDDAKLDRGTLRGNAKKMRKVGITALAEIAEVHAKTAKRKPKPKKARFNIPWRAGSCRFSKKQSIRKVSGSMSGMWKLSQG
jgi:hypothetical protein